MDVVAMLSAYGLLGSAFVAAVGIASGVGDWDLSLQPKSLRVLVPGVAVGILVSGALLVTIYRLTRKNRRSQFWLPVLASTVTVALCLAFAEAAVRVLSEPSPLGVRVGQTSLLPYDWESLRAFNISLIERNQSQSIGSFYVPDPELGWTIAPNRVSEDGLYKSSAEGLRSAVAGAQLSAAPGERLALFGNSYAFSEEVLFEESLGRHLGDELGSEIRVLNFGVPGFGVDQALLRFARDGVEWEPRVAILAFIEDDLRRTAGVYTFMKVWWGIPLSKPRFINTQTGLELWNSPTMAPEEIFGRPSIFDLPLLDYEIDFFAHDWIRHPLHASALLRYLAGKFRIWRPVWRPVNPLTSDDEIVSINVKLIEAFRDRAQSIGAWPIVVYFPTAPDLTSEPNRRLKSRVIRELSSRGVHVDDLTMCIDGKIDVDDLYMPGRHYTNDGNMAAAQCLSPIVDAALRPHGASP